MYLYNIKNQIRPIRREEINDILFELDKDFFEKAESLGREGLKIQPFPNSRAIIVYEEQKWFDRSFDNPNKEVVSGIILYYTLVGNDICTYASFTCDSKDFDFVDGYFGRTKQLGITEDSHFKKIREFTEKIRLLYPDMLSVGNEIFYKNNYLLFNSYPADKKKRFDVAESIKKVEGVSNCKYHKNEPIVSFNYNDKHFVVSVRKNCLLHDGIIYGSTEEFIYALTNGFALKIEDILDVERNLNFIKFVKNPEDTSLEDLIFAEQTKEMTDATNENGELLF